MKAPDHPQSAAGQENLLIVICATLRVRFSSKLKAINIFPKHIVKSEALGQSTQARKKLFCHVIVKIICATFYVSF